jgi:hypothetical protein
VTIQAKRENVQEDLQVIRTPPPIEPLLDPCTHRPESMQVIRLLHQGPAPPWRRSPSWTASCAPPGLMNHGHRHACHERINNMAVPEDMGRDLPPGELLPARNLLDGLQSFLAHPGGPGAGKRMPKRASGPASRMISCLTSQSIDR